MPPHRPSLSRAWPLWLALLPTGCSLWLAEDFQPNAHDAQADGAPHHRPDYGDTDGLPPKTGEGPITDGAPPTPTADRGLEGPTLDAAVPPVDAAAPPVDAVAPPVDAAPQPVECEAIIEEVLRCGLTLGGCPVWRGAQGPAGTLIRTNLRFLCAEQPQAFAPAQHFEGTCTQMLQQLGARSPGFQNHCYGENVSEQPFEAQFQHCGALLDCLMACTSEWCADLCYESATDPAHNQFLDLRSCVDERCPNYQPACQEQSCADHLGPCAGPLAPLGDETLLSELSAAQRARFCTQAEQIPDTFGRRNCPSGRAEPFFASSTKCAEHFQLIQTRSALCTLSTREAFTCLRTLSRDYCNLNEVPAPCLEYYACLEGRSPAHFTCADGEQIPADWRCDGDADCDDASDEHRCPSPRLYCPGDDDPLPLSWICDGDVDCDDERDEQNCWHQRFYLH